jgi:hypothetical protein
MVLDGVRIAYNHSSCREWEDESNSLLATPGITTLGYYGIYQGICFTHILHGSIAHD